MASIEYELSHKIFEDDDMELLRPLISYEESDSASLDRIAELLMLSGFSPEHAMYMCIPPSWEDSDFDSRTKAFFEYQSFLMKPWDGPAAIAFTYDDVVGAHLDRNGLRPIRYLITEDGILVLGSETGMVDLEGRVVKEKGRLGPGDMLSVNLTKGAVSFTDEIINKLAVQKPYGDWIDRFLFRVKRRLIKVPDIDPDTKRKQIAFGYTSEEIQTSIKEMAETAKEMTFS